MAGRATVISWRTLSTGRPEPLGSLGAADRDGSPVPIASRQASAISSRNSSTTLSGFIAGAVVGIGVYASAFDGAPPWSGFAVVFGLLAWWGLAAWLERREESITSRARRAVEGLARVDEHGRVRD